MRRQGQGQTSGSKLQYWKCSNRNSSAMVLGIRSPNLAIRQILCYQNNSAIKWLSTKLKMAVWPRFALSRCFLVSVAHINTYRVGQKVSLRSLHITSSNTGRFSKFFHCHILQEICNKVIIKYSTSPQTCRYTTLWNICALSSSVKSISEAFY